MAALERLEPAILSTDNVLAGLVALLAMAALMREEAMVCAEKAIVASAVLIPACSIKSLMLDKVVMAGLLPSVVLAVACSKLLVPLPLRAAAMGLFKVSVGLLSTLAFWPETGKWDKGLSAVPKLLLVSMAALAAV